MWTATIAGSVVWGREFGFFWGVERVDRMGGGEDS